MITVITAPDDKYSVSTYNAVKLFLAGGITNCPNWQDEMIVNFKKRDSSWCDVVIFNPRRKNFPINDPKAAEEQITWEFDKLKQSDVISFWFSRGSDNPIVLYELGMWCNSRKTNCIVGVDQQYSRKQDVLFQTSLARPELRVSWRSFSEFCDSVWITIERSALLGV